MKFLGGLFILACLVGGAIITYPQWRGPVVQDVPSLNQYLPTLSPTPTPQVVVVAPLATAHAATPAPGPVTPVALVPWSAADCTWALSTMKEDEHLDQQEAWNIAEGFDPRYSNDSEEPVYVTWEMDWAMVVAQLTSMCTTGVPVSADHIAQAQADFALAITSHQDDQASNPQNLAWDEQWEKSYTRISAMYAELA